MSIPEVGQGKVAIFPVFKGFRKGVITEVDGTTREAGLRVTKGFTAAGSTAGRGFSEGFKKQTATVSGDALKKATDDVAKATRELAALRLKEQDATGRSRVAEAQLAEARSKYAADSAQVIRAEERLAASQRQVLNIQESVENSTERLSAAKRSLADASTLASSGGGAGWRRTFQGFGGEAAGGFSGAFRSRVGEIFTGNFLADVAFSAGRSVVVGLGRGIEFGLQFSLQGIDLASALNESVNAANVTFGDDIGEQLRLLAEDAPQRLALTRRAFLQFGTQFSSFAKTIRRDNPASFIDDLTERGADFASVYNLEVADALTLFQSGLAGETEPLRRYGLDLSAARVEAFAYAEGIAASGRALTENEKIQARWGLLLEQTAVTQGDNARTADELAGQQRRLAAAYEETQTKLGQYLLPGFLDLVTIGNKQILPAFGSIIDRVGPKLGAALESIDWQGFADDIAPAIESIAELSAEEGIPQFVRFAEEAAKALPVVVQSWTDDLGVLNDAIDISQGNWAALRRDNSDLYESLGLVFADGRILFGEEGERWMEELERGLEENAGGPQGAVAATLRGIRAEFQRETTIGTRRGGGGSFAAGVNLGDGFADGIESTESTVGAAARRIARRAVGSIRGELAIQSPSRVTRELGRYTGDGMVLGLQDREKAVAQKAASMVSTFSGLSLTAGTASSTAAGRGGGGTLVGTLVLDSGEFLGTVRGIVSEGKADMAAAISGGVVS